jgi:hypothetical protein
MSALWFDATCRRTPKCGVKPPHSKTLRVLCATKILRRVMSRLLCYFIPAKVSSADSTLLSTMKAETSA